MSDSCLRSRTCSYLQPIAGEWWGHFHLPPQTQALEGWRYRNRVPLHSFHNKVILADDPLYRLSEHRHR